MLVFTAFVALGVALVSGCGSELPVPEPDVVIDPDANPAAPPPKPVYEMDPAKHAIPPGPVTGVLGGAEFTPQASIEGDYLIFRSSKSGSPIAEREVMLRLRINPTQSLQNRKWKVGPETPPGLDVPEILVALPGRQTHMDANGYALTLELGGRKDGKLPGKIFLSLPGEEKSFLAGSFVAAAPRQPTEPPGVEDVPLVNGSVTVIGAAPDAVLTTGYAGYPKPDQSPPFAAVDLQLGEPVSPPRWELRDYDKPRVTSLIAGDGKMIPSHYEHSKLTPGAIWSSPPSAVARPRGNGSMSDPVAPSPRT